MAKPKVVVVNFGNAFEWQHVYVDGACLYSDSWTWNDLLEYLDGLGLIEYRYVELSKEAADRQRGKDKWASLETVLGYEKEVLLEQAAALRLRIAELEKEAEALEGEAKNED